MQFVPRAVVIVMVAGFSPSIAFAWSISNQTPQSFDDVKTAIQQIPQELDKAKCGGWADESVGGKIATVNGVPGRQHVWNGSILSGMATRADSNGNQNIDDDFSFPDATKGLMTACSAGKSEIMKSVWCGGEPGSTCEKLFDHPYFEDPPCRWGADGKSADPNAPGTCSNFCRWVNTYTYTDCRPENVQPALDALGNFTGWFCTNPEQRWICSDDWVGNNANVESCDPAGPPTQWPNATSCQGDACRCPGPGACVQSPFGIPYNSYFRQYEGEYSRNKVQAAPKDVASNTAPVACFGFYNEFDPKTRKTMLEDRRCVINIDVASMYDTQQGKGEYGQKSSLPDRNPNENANQRNGGQFNAQGDLWYMKFSGGFSLLSEKTFKDVFDQDLTNVFLNIGALDKASMRATEQLDAKRPLAKSNTVRAFDDTGERRTAAQWWQKQQSEMAGVLHPPIVRILMPAGWSFGVDTDDPFFKDKVKETSDEFDRRNKRIEVQLDADEDVLGTALGYIERSLVLRVEEEPVPLIVPMGSPAEFRAKAEAWCTWYMEQYQKKNCDDAPDDVKKLMTRLEKYADTVDDVRKLRGELARYAGKLLQTQQEITRPIGTWIQANMNEYRRVLNEQEALRAGLGGKWRSVQDGMNRFETQTNLPWCMNQRFTAPVLSLLDDWLPARANGGSMTADNLPDLAAPPVEDIIIDFSTLAYIPRFVPLPVLQPVQIRLGDLPAPPDGKEYEKIPDFPDFPSAAAISDNIRKAADDLPLLSEDVPSPPPIKFNVLGQQGIAQLEGKIGQIEVLLSVMDDRYKKFWKSIGPLKPGEVDSSEDLELKLQKEKLGCMDWDDKTCQHVEMDLVERFMRIGSRPLVMLNEDYDSRGPAKIFEGACLPGDDVCTPAHPESTGERHQWEILGPTSGNDRVDTIRRNIRNNSLPTPVGGISPANFPKYDTDIGDLLPVYDVPRAIDLSPQSSSSSTTSSAASSAASS
jgi:hypothetical protein